MHRDSAELSRLILTVFSTFAVYIALTLFFYIICEYIFGYDVSQLYEARVEINTFAE